MEKVALYYGESERYYEPETAIIKGAEAGKLNVMRDS